MSGPAPPNMSVPVVAPDQVHSLIEEVHEPTGPFDTCSQVHGLVAQRTVRRHQCHRKGGVTGDLKKGVITASGRMDDGNSVGLPSFDATSSIAFKDHYNGFGDASRFHCGAYPLDECSGCFWSIPPPTGWTRPDHVGRVDEEHGPSLADRGKGGT